MGKKWRGYPLVSIDDCRSPSRHPSGRGGAPMRPLTNAEQRRYWRKVVKSDGCWQWNGLRTRQGYGRFYAAPKTYGAHRVAYFLENNRDPGKLMVCHHCDNP